jgi:hypothetical protein
MLTEFLAVAGAVLCLLGLGAVVIALCALGVGENPAEFWKALWK